MTLTTKGVLFAVAATVFAACSSNSNSTPATPAAPAPLHIAYTAIGASDAVGYGASVPCTKASPALVADPTCPEAGASGYVPDIVKGFAQVGFQASLQDLGISGAVIGPDIQATANMYSSAFGATPCQPRTMDAVPGNFLQNELPFINKSATLVTIFAGGNDVNAIANDLACGAGGTTMASQNAFVTQQVTEFGNDYVTLAGTVHAQAPSATIIVANIPNFANVPYAVNAPLPAPVKAQLRAALQGISVAIDTAVINKFASNGIPVVDLQCDPRSYDPTNFYTDGFHPNDVGYADLAGSYLQFALAQGTPPAPAAQCAQQAIMGQARTTEPMAIGHALPVPFR